MGPPRALLNAQEPFALRGCVLTPERKIEGGYVVVGDDRISEVGEGEPDSSLRAVDTGGVILPRLDRPAQSPRTRRVRRLGTS